MPGIFNASRAKENWKKIAAHQKPETIKDWFGNHLTGDKLVDTDKFPEWLKAGILPNSTALKDHLWDKYGEWINPKKGTGAKWAQSDFDLRFQTILNEDSADSKTAGAVNKGRYALLKEDFANHIHFVAAEFRQKYGLQADQTLAIAIYSSSQYTPMNSLARGEKYGNKDGKFADPIDLWFIAKSSIGLKKLGKTQKWNEKLLEAKDETLTDAEVRDSNNQRGVRKLLRRDVQLHDKVIDKTFRVPPPNELKWTSTDPSNKGLKELIWEKIMNGGTDTGFIKPKRNDVYLDLGLMSATTNLQGVSPFNENSNVVFYIELYEHYAPFPAASISELSCYPKESEVLWAPATEFIVTKIRDTRQSTVYKGSDFRDGSRNWGKDEKLEVYLRPKTIWDHAGISYINVTQVQKWLDENMNGSKIVDGDKFPYWNQNIQQSLNMNSAQKENLKDHLWDKYQFWDGWSNNGGIFSRILNLFKSKETLFSAKFNEIVNAPTDLGGIGSQQLNNRNDIVGEDYRRHIRSVANEMSAKKLDLSAAAGNSNRKSWLGADYTLAIAIYSSSEYGKMNLLGRGQPGSSSWHADPFHLWINAKAAVGIEAIGRMQNFSWQKGMKKINTWNGIKINDSSSEVIVLRRDESNYPDSLIEELIKVQKNKTNNLNNKGEPGMTYSKNFFNKPSGDPNGQAITVFKPNFLLSTTKAIEGVSPFNDGSNLAWIIDVSAATPAACMDISPLSAYPKEAEILWRIRQEFEVVEIVDRRMNEVYSNNERSGWDGRKKVDKDHKVFVILKALPFNLDLYPISPNPGTRP